jgi:hypothetical protein
MNDQTSGRQVPEETAADIVGTTVSQLTRLASAGHITPSGVVPASRLPGLRLESTGRIRREYRQGDAETLGARIRSGEVQPPPAG